MKYEFSRGCCAAGEARSQQPKIDPPVCTIKRPWIGTCGRKHSPPPPPSYVISLRQFELDVVGGYVATQNEQPQAQNHRVDTAPAGGRSSTQRLRRCERFQPCSQRQRRYCQRNHADGHADGHSDNHTHNDCDNFPGYFTSWQFIGQRLTVVGSAYAKYGWQPTR